MQYLGFTDEYEVLTENGFRDFEAIKIVEGKIYNVEFSDGSNLEASYTHRFKTLKL